MIIWFQQKKHSNLQYFIYQSIFHQHFLLVLDNLLQINLRTCHRGQNIVSAENLRCKIRKLLVQLIFGHGNCYRSLILHLFRGLLDFWRFVFFQRLGIHLMPT